MAVADIMLGPVDVWYAPAGETLPADTVGYGQPWAGGWSKVGYTKTPVSVNYESEEIGVVLEQALGEVKRFRSSEALTLETVLSEITGDLMALATGGVLTQTAAGVGQPPKDEVEVGGDPVLKEFTWGFEGLYEDVSGNQYPVRFFIYRGTPKLNGAIEFGRTVENGTGIPLQVKAMHDMDKAVGKRLFKFQKITGDAS